MSELYTPDVQFAGFGTGAADAAELARELAAQLSNWSAANPGRHILQMTIQTTSLGSRLHMTAVLAYREETNMSEFVEQAHVLAVDEVEKTVAVTAAEEIVAEAQLDSKE